MIELDVTGRRVKIGNASLKLSPIQFKIVEALAYANTPLPVYDMGRYLYGPRVHCYQLESLKVIISQLRRRLKDAGLKVSVVTKNKHLGVVYE